MSDKQEMRWISLLVLPVSLSTQSLLFGKRVCFPARRLVVRVARLSDKY